MSGAPGAPLGGQAAPRTGSGLAGKRRHSTCSSHTPADARSAIDALHQHVASLEAQLEELAQKSQELERIKKALGRI